MTYNLIKSYFLNKYVAKRQHIKRCGITQISLTTRPVYMSYFVAVEYEYDAKCQQISFTNVSFLGGGVDWETRKEMVLLDLFGGNSARL